MPDHELLAAVRADLTRTPFVGEGGSQGLRTLAHSGRHPRVPPLMREHGLLSPHRQPQKPAQCSRWSNDD
ncbi:MAG: hypothetical protein VB137_11620 [Burkholderia sp.]